MTETTDLNAITAPDTHAGLCLVSGRAAAGFGLRDDDGLADPPRYLVRRERAGPQPSPPWCESPRDTHDFEMWTKDPHVWIRFHELASIGAGWGVAGEEVWRDGVTTMGAPESTWHGDDAPMDRFQAR